MFLSNNNRSSEIRCLSWWYNTLNLFLCCFPDSVSLSLSLLYSLNVYEYGQCEISTTCLRRPMTRSFQISIEQLKRYLFKVYKCIYVRGVIKKFCNLAIGYTTHAVVFWHILMQHQCIFSTFVLSCLCPENSIFCIHSQIMPSQQSSVIHRLVGGMA